MTTPDPVQICERCGRAVWEHTAFHEVPAPADREGLEEAVFPGQPWRGLYCPRVRPVEDTEPL